MFAYITSYFQSVWNSIFGPLLMLTSSLRINHGHHPSSGRLLVLGLDNAGKTTLLQAIRRFDTSNNSNSNSNNNNNLRSYPPTDRPEHIKNIVTINNQITFHAYDLGGHEAVRHLWSDYYNTTTTSSNNDSNNNDSNYHHHHHNTDSTNENNLAILFCIDIADRQRIEEAAYELDALIHDGLHANQNNNNTDTNDNTIINSTVGNEPQPKYGIPIAILLTKCDDMHEANTITDTLTTTSAPLLMTLPQVCDLIDYTSLQQSHDGPMHICTISVYKNTGYIEALQWITKTLVQQQQQR